MATIAPAMPVLFTVLLAFAAHFSVAFHVDEEDGPYTVKLKRQQIPLHSRGGVVQHKSAYHGRITIGSPSPQVMDVVFDTGSGHLVLPSTLCKSPTCTKHKRYNRKASMTSVDIDADGSKVFPGMPRDRIIVSYGTGEITGVFMRDHVCLGGRDVMAAPSSDKTPGSSLLQMRTSPLQKAPSGDSSFVDDDVDNVESDGCATAQVVATTHMTEDPFNTFEFDGVFGLGLTGLSQTKDFNVFNVLANARAFKAMPGFERTFSVFLGRTSEESVITFGGYMPERLLESNFVWHHVDEPGHGYWQIKVFNIIMDGVKSDYCDDGTCRAVVDTGTSLLAVPSDLGPTLVKNLRSVSKSGQVCDTEVPALEIDLGNITVELTPSDIGRPEFIRDVHEQPNEQSESSENDMDKGHVEKTMYRSIGTSCVPMVMFLDLPEPLSKKTLILGEPILQKYYAAFNLDVSAPSIGMALSKHTAPKEALRIR